MADFLTNLWESIFTAGPTPTLLLATNITFGSLQVLLALLLFATYSIHFAILSVLCGGLWYAINWFADEIRQAQAKEEEAERIRKQKKGRDSDWKTKGEVGDSADDEGEDTETETDGAGLKESAASLTSSPMTGTTETTAAATSGAQGVTPGTTSRLRRTGDGDRSGEISSSTDSEWEKVDGER